MTTQQDSVDVERLRAALGDQNCTALTMLVPWLRHNGWHVSADAVDAALAALSLPITQRDEQGDHVPDSRKVMAGPTDAQVREAMQDAWNTFCDDAQAIPGDIYREGRRTFFRAGTWADHTAMQLRHIMERDRLSIEQGDQDGGAVVSGVMRIIVCGSFTAKHSCVEGFPHEHTWRVTAWFLTPVRADARLYRQSLDTMLARLDGTTLPEGADWNEDIALQISKLCNCVKVRVWRESDRLGAEWVA